MGAVGCWPAWTPERAAALARLALDGTRRAYPYKLSHLMLSDADAGTPRTLTPVFYGCFDWHSAVHSHWALARLARVCPRTSAASAARARLAEQLTEARLAGEVAYLTPRPGFERPYGLAWLLQLTAELDAWGRAGEPAARRWRQRLAPLEALAAERLEAWLARLPWPVRSGEHSQSAFTACLAIDHAEQTADAQRAARLRASARRLHGADRLAPVHMEPSGHDFLSPALASAALMRRALPRDAFAAWLRQLIPGLDDPTDASVAAWLEPVRCPDPADGKLAHLDGLNLSRAWMLEGVAGALPVDDPRRARLLDAAQTHGRAGIAAINPACYEGAHWLGSFAVYLLTRRGLDAEAPAVG